MFENLLKDTAYPSLIGLLGAIDKSLEGVKKRLTDLKATGDHITALVAEQQLNALSAWEPMLVEIRDYLNSQITHTAPHATVHPTTTRDH